MTFQEWLKEWLGVNEGGTGPPGPAGPPGPPGPAGPSDPSLTARVAALEARVDALAAPVIVNPQPEPTLLLGVGSASTSLVDYPKTGPVTSGDWYVDPNAATNGTGTQGSPFDNLASALSVVSDGQTILVRAGTLYLSAMIYRNTAWATGVNVFGYGTERPVLDFASNTSIGNLGKGILFDTNSANEHWKGFKVTNTTNIGVDIQGLNNKVEDMWFTRCGTDLSTTPGRGIVRTYRSSTTSIGAIIQDCRVWRNGNGTDTGTNAPDCYQVAASTYSVGVKFIRCLGAHGADDCFDLWGGNGVEIIDCVAYKGGYYWNGVSAGDGSGFKGGGRRANIGRNTVKGSVAIACKSEAIKPNSSPEPITALNCTSVDAVGYGFNFSSGDGAGTKHTVKNCVDANSGRAVGMNSTYVTATFNSWDLGITDPRFANAARHDYSLASSSGAIGAADDGGNLGASTVALEIAREWLGKDLGA